MSFQSRISNFFSGRKTASVQAPQQSLVPAMPAAPKAEKRDFDLKSQEALRLFVFGTPSTSGVSVNIDSALTLPPMFSAIRYISEGIAMLDREVKKRKKDGSIVDAFGHPIFDLMKGVPHPYYIWSDFLKALVSNACLGNGYALIHWDELTMRPMYLEHIPQGDCWPEFIGTDLYYNISGVLNGQVVSKRVPYTDVIHLKGFTTNAINGRSIPIVHRPTIGSGIAAQQYSESLFGKGAHPSIAVKYNEVLDDDQRKNIEDNIMAIHGGSANAGRPLVLDGGMDIQYLQWSPQDVALMDFNTLNAQQVSMITKVPQDLLFSTGTGTYGSALQRNQNFLTHCLGPWREQLQEEFNYKLFQKQEFKSRKYFFQCDSSVFLKMDAKTEAEVIVSLVAGSLLTPNEGRRRLGLNAVPGGDELFGNINSLPLKDLVEVAKAKYLSAAGERAAAEQENAAQAKGSLKSDTEHEPESEQQD